MFNIHSPTNEKASLRLSKSFGSTRTKAEYCSDNRETRDDEDSRVNSLLHAYPLSLPSDLLEGRRGLKNIDDDDDDDGNF